MGGDLHIRKGTLPFWQCAFLHSLLREAAPQKNNDLRGDAEEKEHPFEREIHGEEYR